MRLDASLLREYILDQSDETDASGIISLITTIESFPENREQHFFKVSLFDVTNDQLLEISDVKDYLSMVAPVGFPEEFKLKDQISAFFEKRGFPQEEYHVELNEEKIFKGYENFILDKDGIVVEDAELVEDMGGFEIKDQEKQLLAICWFGFFTKVNYILHEKNIFRGIRIRKNNISIGDETTLIPRFPQQRTQYRYFGEVHVLGPGFIPNARRDYFNDNETLKKFQDALKDAFEDFEKTYPNIASQLVNRKKEIESYLELKENFDRDKVGFQTEQEKQQRFEKLRRAEAKAKKASKKIENLRIKTQGKELEEKLFNKLVVSPDYSILFEAESKLDDLIVPPLEFSKLDDKGAELLNEVVNMIESHFGIDKARTFIGKLKDRYN